MAQEIELKFIVDSAAINALRGTLQAFGGEHSAPRKLLNIYYETPDNTLRLHDMGLRIRGDNGHYEMTMKLAGQVIGGLHQRPEYNVALAQPALNIDLFPDYIWPQGINPGTLQKALRPLFSTDFIREKWVITRNQSTVEIALDQGDIQAGELREPLCELELEFIAGDASVIFDLAQELVKEPGLRQGSLSKAARGYHLAQGDARRDIKWLGILPLPAKARLEQALEGALEMALNHWQYHEELWMRGNASAKEQVKEAVMLVRHLFVLFGGVIPRKASTHLRELLLQLEPAFEQDISAAALVFSTRYAQAKLALTTWRVNQCWRTFLDDTGRMKIVGSFKRFADTHLSRCAASLRGAFLHPLAEGYESKLPRLAREMDAIRLLAGVYDEEKTQLWLANWQGLYRAIIAKNAESIEHFRLKALSQPPFWLHSGK